ncbi:MAG: hypothetical protein AB7Q16_25605 [Vicinamibacterales bacterium]
MVETARGGQSDDASPLVRAAEWLGRTLGRWRRDRHQRRDDEFIRAWKRAWTEGCEARWSGKGSEDGPHKKGPEHDAWRAGWLWADTQPDRRDGSRLPSRAHARRRASDLDQESEHGA